MDDQSRACLFSDSFGRRSLFKLGKIGSIRRRRRRMDTSVSRSRKTVEYCSKRFHDANHCFSINDSMFTQACSCLTSYQMNMVYGSGTNLLDTVTISHYAMTLFLSLDQLHLYSIPSD